MTCAQFISVPHTPLPITRIVKLRRTRLAFLRSAPPSRILDW